MSALRERLVALECKYGATLTAKEAHALALAAARMALDEAARECGNRKFTGERVSDEEAYNIGCSECEYAIHDLALLLGKEDASV